jgi:Bacterial PH domain
MATARYQLPQHPTLAGPHSKDELYFLVERGSISRGEIVFDRMTGRSHKIGQLIGEMRPPVRAERSGSKDRPAYQEFSGDTPWEIPGQRRTTVVRPSPTSEEVIDAEEEEDEEEEIDLDAFAEDNDDDETVDEEEEDQEEDVRPDAPASEAPIILYHGHPSWLSYSRPLLLCFVYIAIGIAALPYGAQYLAASLLLACLTFLYVIVSRQYRDFYVTDERVELEWGIIGRSSREVRVADIRSMDVHESGLLGLLGIGTLDFSSSGTDGVEVQFKNVRRPHKVKQLVRDLQKLLED